MNAPDGTSASDAEREELATVVAAQRAMLRARRPTDVVRALADTVHRLGGSVVDADTAGDEVIQLDLGLGDRDPLLPWAAPDDPAHDRLRRLLPGLVEDGARLVNRLRGLEEHGDTTLLDELTGTLHTVASDRLLGRSVTGDVVVALGFAEVEAIERVHGRVRLEVLLRHLAHLIRSEVDVDERVGRLGHTVLMVLLPHPDQARPGELIERLRLRWADERILAVELTSAVVEVAADSGTAAAEVVAALEGRADDAGTASGDGGRPTVSPS